MRPVNFAADTYSTTLRSPQAFATAGGGAIPMTIAGTGANSDFRLGTTGAGVQAIDAGGSVIGPINQTWANFAGPRPGGFANPVNLATIAVAA